MNRRSIIQEYYILAVNEKGYMPAMRREKSNAGLVAAGMMELLLNGIITVEKKKITVAKELPDNLGYLVTLYEYLQNKVRTTDKLMSDYIASTGSRIQQLTEGIGEALLGKHAVTKGEGGFFGNKVIYIPEKGYKEELIRLMKLAAANEGDMSPQDMALISVLEETKNLNQYFSDFERTELKAKLKELKKNPGNKQLRKMINYVSDMTAVMAAVVLMQSSS